MFENINLKKIALGLSIFVLFIIGYWKIFFAEFLYDDLLLIFHNSYITSFENLKLIFTTSSTSGAGVESNLYRPLSTLIYTIIYSFFLLEPFYYHAVNIFLHFFTAYLVYRLLCIFQISQVLSYLLASIFLLHPMFAEVAGYASGLPDTLSGFFIFLLLFIILNDLRSDEDVSRLGIILRIGVFVLALLSKEIAIIVPALLALVYFSFDYSPDKRRYLKLLIGATLFISIIFVILKLTVFNFTGNLALHKYATEYTESVLVRFQTFFNYFPEYFVRFFSPTNLYFSSKFNAYSFFTTQSIIAIVASILILAFSFLRFKSDKRYIFSVAWIFLSLFLVSGIPIAVNAVLFDHWFYIPSFGLLLFLGLIFDSLRIKKIYKYFLISIFIAFLFNSLIHRNSQWSDPVAFFENEILYNESAENYTQLGFLYTQRLQMNTAGKYFAKAMELDPDYPLLHYYLATFAYLSGDQKSAVDGFYRCLAVEPSFIPALNGLLSIALNLSMDSQIENFNAILEQAKNGNRIGLDQLPPKETFY